MTRRARTACACVVVGMVSAVFAGGSASSAAPSAQESPTVWLCRPGMKDNPCESNLTTTVVNPNGKKTTQRASTAKNPPVDCFYVYPTVSAQQSVNATLDVDPELIAVAENQAARFSQVCRIYAPVYPQLTLSSIGRGANPEARAAAYAGVLAGWKEYLAKYNKGRGVVFIGHSQGSGMLTQLLKTEVDPNPRLRRQTVSALLLGGNVTVPEGKDVGGDFQNIPACRSAKETHCVVAYSMYAQQPPPDGLFGKTRVGDGRRQPAGALCEPDGVRQGQFSAAVPADQAVPGAHRSRRRRAARGVDAVDRVPEAVPRAMPAGQRLHVAPGHRRRQARRAPVSAAWLTAPELGAPPR